MALVSLFLKGRCLTFSFSRGNWITEVATSGCAICILGCHFGSDTCLCVQNKKREKMPVIHSFIHISLILFFLCILWLLWCALSCQCVQADLFSWCMHNLVVISLVWRRRPLKHKWHMCVCVSSLSWVQLMCHYGGFDETTKPRKQATVYDIEMAAEGSWHSHLLSHIPSIVYKSTIVGDNTALD